MQFRIKSYNTDFQILHKALPNSLCGLRKFFATLFTLRDEKTVTA
jgi:hypothetical protein